MVHGRCATARRHSASASHSMATASPPPGPLPRHAHAQAAVCHVSQQKGKRSGGNGASDVLQRQGGARTRTTTTTSRNAYSNNAHLCAGGGANPANSRTGAPHNSRLLLLPRARPVSQCLPKRTTPCHNGQDNTSVHRVTRKSPIMPFAQLNVGPTRHVTSTRHFQCARLLPTQQQQAAQPHQSRQLPLQQQPHRCITPTNERGTCKRHFSFVV